MLLTVLFLDITSRISAIVFYLFRENVYVCLFVSLLSLLDGTLGPYTFLLMSDKFKTELVGIRTCISSCFVTRSEGNLERMQSEKGTHEENAIESMNSN